MPFPLFHFSCKCDASGYDTDASKSCNEPVCCRGAYEKRASELCFGRRGKGAPVSPFSLSSLRTSPAPLLSPSPPLLLQLSPSLFPFPASGKLLARKACIDVRILLSPDSSSVAARLYLSTYVSISSGLSPSFTLSLPPPSLPHSSVPHREYTSGCSPTCFIALLTAYY